MRNKIRIALFCVAAFVIAGCASQSRYEVAHSAGVMKMEDVAIIKNPQWSGSSFDRSMRLGAVLPIDDAARTSFSRNVPAIGLDTIGGPQFIEVAPGGYLVTLVCFRGNWFAYPKVQIAADPGKTYALRCVWPDGASVVGAALESVIETPKEFVRDTFQH